MTDRFFRRSLRRLRAVVFLALALCVLVQPVLAAVGELHESVGHATSVGHHADAAPHDGERGSDADPDSDAWHLLLHYAHCCGHAPGLAVAFTPSLLELFPSRPPALLPVSAAPFRQTVPFRPPILA